MEFVYVLLGVLIGSIISNVAFYIRTASGVLKVDHSNPEKDVYRIEINEFDAFDYKKRILLKVDHNADLSQK